MRQRFFLVWHIALACLFSSPSLLFAAAQGAPEATVVYANREIVVLRATIQGATPEVRAKRIQERLNKLEDKDLLKPIERTHGELGALKGELFSMDGRTLFLLLEDDLDSEAKTSIKEVSDQAEARLNEAFDALKEQRKGPVLLKGILFSALATIVMVILQIGIQRMTRVLLDRLQKRIQSARDDSRVRWVEHAWLFFQRVAKLGLAFLWISVAYLWFTFVLDRFPITQPFADKLSGFLTQLISLIGHGAITSLPGILTVLVILFLTKSVNDVVSNIFVNVDLGRSVIPGIHRDTAHATRRIVAIVIWGFGIAVAYPFLPLANSDAFKGLSVMFGFMLTLGSAGIVTQMMSGLVLIYSRALKVGDFVSVGEIMGVVRESGVLSTKIINMRNEEVTIPNALLVGSPIKNFTSAGGEKGALISTTVTIGYDTPWRQVHAMLILAAEKTEGLRNLPKPFVMQKGLQDFYVEYELYAYVDRPLERIQILSALHANIQDEFNTHGVQIMSPHFVLQPKNNLVVPKEGWSPEPSDKI